MPLPTSVRKIGPTRRSVSGYYAFRGEESIAFESTLERDFLIKADFDVSVLGVISQRIHRLFYKLNVPGWSGIFFRSLVLSSALPHEVRHRA